MTIRRATAADLAAIVELERSAATAAHWSHERYKRLFVEEAEFSTHRIVLVSASESHENSVPEKRSHICGFLVALVSGPEWEIENIAVAETARRRGLAKALVRELVSQARARGAEAMFLEVRQSNQAASMLYENLGFVAAGRRRSYYSGPTEDAILYRLGLA